MTQIANLRRNVAVGGDRTEVDGGVKDGSVHEPEGAIAGHGVFPEKVCIAVIVEVADRREPHVNARTERGRYRCPPRD